MDKNDVDLDELDAAIHKANEATKKRPDLTSKLTELTKKMEAMKVASLQLIRLRDDFERGNVTTEDYQVQSKRLRMDIERARNEADLLSIIHNIRNEEKKSTLLRLKETIISNKDFIIAVAEILKSILTGS